ncbi:MAG TPA: hypothetical protein VFU90_00135 [Candidatus Tumulicola sp.]|nr:hypothetical protein [Candidatus Tumulicola sp.]
MKVTEMRRKRSSKRLERDAYRQVAIQVGQASAGGRAAEERMNELVRAGAPLSDVDAAYRAIGELAQEPLPAQPALDRNRPAELTRELSALRTRRQWYLMDAPPGALPPAVVRPTSRAPKGPHVAGLDADFDERPWGVDLAQALDRLQ